MYTRAYFAQIFKELITGCNFRFSQLFFLLLIFIYFLCLFYLKPKNLNQRCVNPKTRLFSAQISKNPSYLRENGAVRVGNKMLPVANMFPPLPHCSFTSRQSQMEEPCYMSPKSRNPREKIERKRN